MGLLFIPDPGGMGQTREAMAEQEHGLVLFFIGHYPNSKGLGGFMLRKVPLKIRSLLKIDSKKFPKCIKKEIFW